MPTDQKTVLITGCSSGSLGAGLALAFHEKGLKVFATVRDLDKASELEKAGIQCLQLDVLSDDSIKSCVDEVTKITSGSLDILVNNAGGGYYMPFIHVDIKTARELFDINVWSHVAMSQAFIPLLMKTASPSKTGKKTLLVNNTSISSVLKTPYHSVYGASKAALASFNDAQRIELQPFGIRVIDLKTGSTESNFSENRSNPQKIPEDSPYKPIEDEVMNVITGAATEAYAEDRMDWARNVVSDLLQDNPPSQVWRGGKAGMIKYLDSTPLPDSLSDPGFRDLGGLDKLEKILQDKEGGS